MMERISVNTYVDAESDHKVENNGEDGDHGEDAEVEDDGEDIVVQMKIVERKKEKINVSRNRRSKKSGRRSIFRNRRTRRESCPKTARKKGVA